MSDLLPGISDWGSQDILPPPLEPPFDHPSLGAIDLASGAYEPTMVDLSLPAPGFRWTIGRAFSGSQSKWDHSGSVPELVHHDSDGYQGWNWMQLSQPQAWWVRGGDISALDYFESIVVLLDPHTSIVLYELLRDSNTFRQQGFRPGFVAVRNEGTGAITLTNPEGKQWVFAGPTSASGPCNLFKITDAAGNAAYVGTSSTTLTDGYGADGEILEAHDSAGRKYEYTYATYTQGAVTLKRLTQVKALVSTTEIARVDYSYYTADEDYKGSFGDLKQVSVVTPTHETSVAINARTHYRYYTENYDTTNEGNPAGWPHLIKLVVGPEGTRRYDWQDSTWNDSHFSADLATLKPYSQAFLAYENDDVARRVVETFNNGECGCSGSSDGVHELAYVDQAAASVADYVANEYVGDWLRRTVMTKPAVGSSNSYTTHYFDIGFLPIVRVESTVHPDSLTSNDPRWVWVTKRDANGEVQWSASPAAVQSYAHTSSGDIVTTKASSGLVTFFEYEYGTGASGQVGVFALPKATRWGEGTSATNRYLISSTEWQSRYLDAGGVTTRRDFPRYSWVYDTPTTQIATHGGTVPSGARETVREYTFWSNTSTDRSYALPKSILTRQPKVSTGNNGRGSGESDPSVESAVYLRKDGTPAFSREPAYSDASSSSLVFDYTRFTNGQMVTHVRDVVTNGTFVSGDDPATDFGITESAAGTGVVTTFAYDAQGRLDTTTMMQADGSTPRRVSKNYYTRLSDHRSVLLSIPRVDGSTYKGPIGYSVSNHAGRSDASGVIALSGGSSSTALTSWINESSSDPVAAVIHGTLERLSGGTYDNPGSRPLTTTVYHTIASTLSASTGDTTAFGYDPLGRRWRTKDPTGTITRTVFDTLGRATAQWTGLNDNSFLGGESSGTDDMVKTTAFEFDGGGSGGNSLLTKVTNDPDGDWSGGNSDARTVEYVHDARGRTVVQKNPTAPHVVNEYDNRGRTTAVGLYSSASGLGLSTDPDASGVQSNRIGLSQSFYDEVGRAWKSVFWNIDPQDGSNDDSLENLTWFDAESRVIKSDGEQLTKAAYDRLGRATHSFLLMGTNDTGYSDADDVSGDAVAEESQTVYEDPSGLVVMSATISRPHTSTGGGALDSNGDASRFKYTETDLSGRIQITAMWYDELDRLQDTVALGNSGQDESGTMVYDRAGASTPARSDTALRTTNAYNADGSLQQVTDPMERVTRFEYDDAGRQVKVISNYVDGTPSDATDQTIVYAYTNGLMSSMTADLPGSSDDQTTAYTYSVRTTESNGIAHSKLNANNMLRSAVYPDIESGESDNDHTVFYGYNALGELVTMRDQAGNVIQTVYDKAGREEHRRATTIQTGSGFDNRVQRITTAYTVLGQVDTVAQYDDPDAGEGTCLDEVNFDYSPWGPVTQLTQDADSAITGGSGRGSFSVAYSLAKATTGRNTIRRTTMTLPDSTVVAYRYVEGGLSTTPNPGDNDSFSRVSHLRIGGTEGIDVVEYDYLGASRPVGTDYPEPSMEYRFYDSSSGYPGLDRFDRVKRSRWTKNNDSPAVDADAYSVTISYDRNSGITAIDETTIPTAPPSGMYPFRTQDFELTSDALDRLTKSKRGTAGGGGSFTLAGQEEWDLSLVGNWAKHKADFDGDGAYTSAGDFQALGSFNKANEQTSRAMDTNNNGSGEHTYTPVYDKAGNRIDDGQRYKAVYDAFGRLVAIKKRTSPYDTVVEYTYNGLGHRTGWHYDVDGDGTLESASGDADPMFWFCYDEAWRVVATYRKGDTAPKERFVYHAAGLGGFGDGSYIDALVLREKDANSAWNAASDTLEQRVYYLQNWRADVVALVNDFGLPLEYVRYSPYGVPRRVPLADYNDDGVVDSFDYDDLTSDWDDETYRRAADVNLDGVVDSFDIDDFLSDYYATTDYGRGVLSGDAMDGGLGNRKGYAGYEFEPALAGDGDSDSPDDPTALYHVRHRVYDAARGTWTRRDPLGYVDGMTLYEYSGGTALSALDPTGLAWLPCSSGGCGGIDEPLGGVTPTILAEDLPYDCSNNFYFVGTLSQVAPPVSPVRPSPVRPGPLWTPDPQPVRVPGRFPRYVPRTPGIMLPLNQCIMVGCVAYCVGATASPYLFPDIDPTIPQPKIGPRVTPKPSSDPCEQAKKRKRGACGDATGRTPSPPLGFPETPQGKKGSRERQLWCDQLNRRIKNMLNCLAARRGVTDACYGGQNEFAHYLEEETLRLLLDRMNRVRRQLCP